MRKACRRRVVVPMPPRGLRPRLDAGQVIDLSICHNSNLDSIARGDANDTTLWHWAESVFTWSNVAELMDVGVPEMEAQLTLTAAVIERFNATGRIVFTGPEYQLAKDGVCVMDQLAEIVDRPTALMAVEWSRAKLQALAVAGREAA